MNTDEQLTNPTLHLNPLKDFWHKRKQAQEKQNIPFSCACDYVVSVKQALGLGLVLGLGLGFGLRLIRAFVLGLGLGLPVFFSQIKHFDSWLIKTSFSIKLFF